MKYKRFYLSALGVSILTILALIAPYIEEYYDYSDVTCGEECWTTFCMKNGNRNLYFYNKESVPLTFSPNDKVHEVKFYKKDGRYKSGKHPGYRQIDFVTPYTKGRKYVFKIPAYSRTCYGLEVHKDAMSTVKWTFAGLDPYLYPKKITVPTYTKIVNSTVSSVSSATKTVKNNIIVKVIEQDPDVLVQNITINSTHKCFDMEINESAIKTKYNFTEVYQYDKKKIEYTEKVATLKEDKVEEIKDLKFVVGASSKEVFKESFVYEDISEVDLDKYDVKEVTKKNYSKADKIINFSTKNLCTPLKIGIEYFGINSTQVETINLSVGVFNKTVYTGLFSMLSTSNNFTVNFEDSLIDNSNNPTSGSVTAGSVTYIDSSYNSISSRYVSLDSSDTISYDWLDKMNITKNNANFSFIIVANRTGQPGIIDRWIEFGGYTTSSFGFKVEWDNTNSRIRNWFGNGTVGSDENTAAFSWLGNTTRCYGFTFDGNTVEYYLDGNNFDSDIEGEISRVLFDESTWKIGNADSEFAVDKIGVFDRVLTDSEILDFCNSSLYGIDHNAQGQHYSEVIALNGLGVNDVQTDNFEGGFGNFKNWTGQWYIADGQLQERSDTADGAGVFAVTGTSDWRELEINYTLQRFDNVGRIGTCVLWNNNESVCMSFDGTTTVRFEKVATDNSRVAIGTSATISTIRDIPAKFSMKVLANTTLLGYREGVKILEEVYSDRTQGNVTFFEDAGQVGIDNVTITYVRDKLDTDVYNRTNVSTYTSIPSGTSMNVSVSTKRMNITDKLLAYYDFDGDDLGISTCKDISSNGHGGIVLGGTNPGITTNNSYNRRSFDHNGTDNNNAGCEISPTGLANINHTEVALLFNQRSQTNPSGQRFFDTDGITLRYTNGFGVAITLGGAGTKFSFNEPSIGVWHWLFGFYNGTHYCTQLDDGTPSCNTFNGTVTSISGNLYIGSDKFNDFINGKIDNVIWWNRTLTSQERACVLDSTCLSNWTDTSSQSLSGGNEVTTFTIPGDTTYVQFIPKLGTENSSYTPILYDMNVTFYTEGGGTVVNVTCPTGDNCLIDCSSQGSIDDNFYNPGYYIEMVNSGNVELNSVLEYDKLSVQNGCTLSLSNTGKVLASK